MESPAHPDAARCAPATADRSPEQRFLGELRGARSAGARVPDFFIVGHAKCGTTALHRMLAGHPQIFLPAVKETEFLSREAPNDSEAEDSARRRPAHLPVSLHAYLALFEGAGETQRAGEASPQYIRSTTAASRIAALRPDARIIAIFREPASFLRSFHLQLLEAGIERERDFATALGLEDERRRGRQIPPGCHDPQRLLYSDHVRYVEQLRRYHEWFGRKQVLALIYDDFRRDNVGTVRQVLRFLELDDSLPIQTTEANATVASRSPRAHALLHDTAVGRGPVLAALRTALKATTPRRVRRSALRSIRRTVLNRPAPPADEELMHELRCRFEGEVAATGDYLERDLLSLWGYRATAATGAARERQRV